MNELSARRRRARSALTPAAAAVAAMVTLTAAQAQQSQQVTVTGIRAAIESAISVKKNSDNIVEAINAEDIGKLPDNSIAESIARLPGVAAQRVAGRAQTISIRGLSGDFSTTLFNGREQVSTGDNRGVEFDQYPSELLSGVVIYKTPDGSLIGQGLSGTVDLRTLRPLDQRNRTVSVNLREERSGLSTSAKGNGSRFNFSYVDQNAAKTVGVALGFARLKSDTGSLRSETYNENNTVKFDGKTLYPGWKGDAPGSVVQFNGGFKQFNDRTEQTRDSLLGVLEFKPSKNLHSVVDLYYSKFDRELVRRGLEIQPEDSWRDMTNPRYPGLKDANIQNGRLISGTWLNVNPLARTIFEPRKDTNRALGWNTSYKFSENWKAIADLSYSNAKRDERIIEMEAGIPTPSFIKVSNYNQLSGLEYNFGDPTKVKLMDPESWGQNGYDKTFITNDTLKSARLAFERDLDGLFSRVNFGFNTSERTKTKEVTEYKLILKQGAGAAVDLPAGSGSIDVGNGFQSISFNPNTVYPSYYNLDPNRNGDIFEKSWSVNERVGTAFVRGDLDTKLAGRPLRGNVGLQVVNTDQSSTGPSVDNSNQSVATTFTDGKRYTDVLPSTNLILELANDQRIRFGAGKVLARARMDQMRATRRAEVGKDDLKWSGGGGNPLLDPFRATALDLAYEKYFATRAYVGVAGFYKKLDSYIFDFTDPAYNFSGFVNISGRTPVSNLGRFSQPRNGKGGTVEGIEISGSLPFDLLSKSLDGFGTVISHADTRSAIKPFGDGDTRSLPGLSRKVSSFILYYERSGFATRVAQRYRSDFLGEIVGFAGSRSLDKYIKAEAVTDLQVSYNMNAGFFKGASLLLQVNNLNNAKYQEYTIDGQGNKNNNGDGVKYGKSVLMGLTYKF